MKPSQGTKRKIFCTKCHIETNDVYPSNVEICRSCFRARARELYKKKRQIRLEQMRENYKVYFKTEQGKKKKEEWRKRMEELFPERSKARSLARQKIVVKGICSLCGTKGRTDRHHPDYSQPLYIIELCRSCHRSTHARLHSSNPDTYVPINP